MSKQEGYWEYNEDGGCRFISRPKLKPVYNEDGSGVIYKEVGNTCWPEMEGEE